MEVCYWALLFMPLVILHHLLNVSVQLANKRGLKKKKKRIFLENIRFEVFTEVPTLQRSLLDMARYDSVGGYMPYPVHKCLMPHL
jgi:hypothetical protein